MSLDIQDKKYIRREIRREIRTEIKASEKRTNHRTDLLIEKVRDDIKTLGETMEARTRIIVREEVAQIVAPLYQYNDIMRQEFAALRGEFNAHTNNHAIHC